MATLHIRKFPETLYRRLTRLATQERRSLSAEVTLLLERELMRVSRSPEKALLELDRARFRPSKGTVPPSVELLRADRRR